MCVACIFIEMCERVSPLHSPDVSLVALQGRCYAGARGVLVWSFLGSTAAEHITKHLFAMATLLTQKLRGFCRSQGSLEEGLQLGLHFFRSSASVTVMTQGLRVSQGEGFLEIKTVPPRCCLPTHASKEVKHPLTSF